MAFCCALSCKAHQAARAHVFKWIPNMSCVMSVHMLAELGQDVHIGCQVLAGCIFTVNALSPAHVQVPAGR